MKTQDTSDIGHKVETSNTTHMTVKSWTIQRMFAQSGLLLIRELRAFSLSQNQQTASNFFN